MVHTVIPPPRCTAATLELTHKGNIHDKTISERDREVRDFNVTLLASAMARRLHLAIDTHRTDLGVTRQGCHYIHEMIVTANRTCVLLASEDMITQRIDTHLAAAKLATVSVGKHLGDGRSETPAEKSLPNVWRETSLKLIRGKVRQKTKRAPVEVHLLNISYRGPFLWRAVGPFLGMVHHYGLTCVVPGSYGFVVTIFLVDFSDYPFPFLRSVL